MGTDAASDGGERGGPATPGAGRRRPLGLALAKLALGVLLIALLVWSQRGGLGRLLDQPPALPWVALGLVAIVASELLAMWRWHLLLRVYGVPCSLGGVVRLGYTGLFFNLFVPGAISGDVIRAVYLGQAAGRRSQVAFTVVLDRLFGLLSLPCVAVLGLCLQRNAWPVAWIGGLGAIVLVLLAGLLHVLRKKAGSDGRGTGGRWRVLLMCLALSLVSQLVAVGAFGAVLRGCTTEGPGLAVLLYVCPAAWLVGSLPVTPGGLGLTEGAYQYLLVGLPEGQGLAAALAYRMCVALTTLPGLVFYLTHRRRVAQQTEPAAPARTSRAA